KQLLIAIKGAKYCDEKFEDNEENKYQNRGLQIYAIIQIHLSMIVLQTALYRTARSRVNTSIILKKNAVRGL
ncbi:hypothetical protein, partial [Bacteroides pyogenes]|uniref:hypothetical protein n=1 Tax=Bacteroides pyogenes TaxID=310300 RepID=UPI001F1D6351